LARFPQKWADGRQRHANRNSQEPIIMSIRLNVVSRLAASVGAAALFVIAGCGVAPQEGDGEYGAASVQCPAQLDGWAVGVKYNVGDLVTFKGGLFQCRQAHTPVDGWFPDVVAALWTPVQCANGAPTPPPPAQQPPAQQPPAQVPPAQGNGKLTVLKDVDVRAFTFGSQTFDLAANAQVPGFVNFTQANNVTAAAFNELDLVANQAVVKVSGTVREVDLTVGGVKRLHSIYNSATGEFKGVVVGNASDQGAPFCFIMTPQNGGFLQQIVGDVGNNLKNDFEGKVLLDANLNPVKAIEFVPGNGGLSPSGPGGNTECPGLVKQFGFTLKGF
jgi:hypothetical protein